MGDVVKSFLKCRQCMHKSFPGDYQRKGKTCFAVRLVVKNYIINGSNKTTTLGLRHGT